MERVTTLSAKVQDGVLSVLQDGVYLPADDVLLLSAGGSNSEGIVIIGAEFSAYVVNTQPDAQYIIDQLALIAEKLSETCNSVATTGSPLAPAIAVEVEAIQAELEAFTLL